MTPDLAIDTLKSQGIKITPQRRVIIEALHQEKSPLTVQELLQKVRQRFPDISHDTVYRTIGLLLQLQVVVPLHLTDGETVKYELQDPRNPHHHLICLGCGDSFCIDDCPLERLPVPEAGEIGFTVKWHTLEFYGYCHKCTTIGGAE